MKQKKKVKDKKSEDKFLIYSCMSLYVWGESVCRNHTIFPVKNNFLLSLAAKISTCLPTDILAHFHLAFNIATLFSHL